MKGLLLKKYMELEVTDMPQPEIGPNDVLVRVRACGICGSDVHGPSLEQSRAEGLCLRSTWEATDRGGTDPLDDGLRAGVAERIPNEG